MNDNHIIKVEMITTERKKWYIECPVPSGLLATEAGVKSLTEEIQKRIAWWDAQHNSKSRVVSFSSPNTMTEQDKEGEIAVMGCVVREGDNSSNFFTN